MHELSITQSILELAEKVGKEHGVQRVKTIHIRVGAYSGLLPQCIQAYFDVVSQGTLAEGARLDIQTLPVVVHCNSCGQDMEIDRRNIRCPLCASTRLKMIQGREFYLEKLEVE